MIRTCGLTRKFGDLVAVEGLDLEIANGEVFGFLGPNGAGKTTTVRMLAALIAPTSGRAWVADHELGVDNAKIRAAVGILTETPGLYERLDPLENLRLFARLHEVDDVEARVQKYLELVGLWDRRFEPVGEFSKGMRQKVAIARALLHEPRVLFLDEPTSGLDPISAKVVRDFIANLKDQGRTIFICTHNLDEADRLCDRIGVFKRRLVKVDTPAALRRSLYGRVVRITVKAVEAPMIAAIAALEVATREIEHDDTTIRVSVNDPEAQNPLIVRALVEAKAEIQFIAEEKESLERIYFDLLGEKSDADQGGTQGSSREEEGA